MDAQIDLVTNEQGQVDLLLKPVPVTAQEQLMSKQQLFAACDEAVLQEGSCFWLANQLAQMVQLAMEHGALSEAEYEGAVAERASHLHLALQLEGREIHGGLRIDAHRLTAQEVGTALGLAVSKLLNARKGIGEQFDSQSRRQLMASFEKALEAGCDPEHQVSRLFVRELPDDDA